MIEAHDLLLYPFLISNYDNHLLLYLFYVIIRRQLRSLRLILCQKNGRCVGALRPGMALLRLHHDQHFTCSPRDSARRPKQAGAIEIGRKTRHTDHVRTAPVVFHLSSNLAVLQIFGA